MSFWISKDSFWAPVWSLGTAFGVHFGRWGCHLLTFWLCFRPSWHPPGAILLQNYPDSSPHTNSPTHPPTYLPAQLSTYLPLLPSFLPCLLTYPLTYLLTFSDYVYRILQVLPFTRSHSMAPDDLQHITA